MLTERPGFTDRYRTPGHGQIPNAGVTGGYGTPGLGLAWGRPEQMLAPALRLCTVVWVAGLAPPEPLAAALPFPVTVGPPFPVARCGVRAGAYRRVRPRRLMSDRR